MIDVADMLETLVRIDSVNPALDPRGQREAAMAKVLDRAWVSLDEVRRVVDVYVALAQLLVKEERNP